MITVAELVAQTTWIRIGKDGAGPLIPAFFLHPDCTPQMRARWGWRWDGNTLVLPDWWPR